MTCQDHELLNEIEILKKRLIDLETQLQSEKQKQSESLEGLAVQKKQLELMKKTDLDIPQFLDQTLDQLIYSTGSKLGYISFMMRTRKNLNYIPFPIQL
jgi:predicted nuclease with TOPRIM domain